MVGNSSGTIRHPANSALQYINSTEAFLINLSIVMFGFIWKTFFKESPYDALLAGSGAAFGWYTGRRLLAKQAKFNPECNGETK